MYKLFKIVLNKSKRVIFVETFVKILCKIFVKTFVKKIAVKVFVENSFQKFLGIFSWYKRW